MCVETLLVRLPFSHCFKHSTWIVFIVPAHMHGLISGSKRASSSSPRQILQASWAETGLVLLIFFMFSGEVCKVSKHSWVLRDSFVPLRDCWSAASSGCSWLECSEKCCWSWLSWRDWEWGEAKLGLAYSGRLMAWTWLARRPPRLCWELVSFTSRLVWLGLAPSYDWSGSSSF